MTGTPSEHKAPRREATGALLPGASIAGGRYRLLTRIGSDDRVPAQLWRGRDNSLGRDVALTLLVGDPRDPDSAARARRTLERSMRQAGFSHPGVARLIDVLWQGNGLDPAEGLYGIVVAEWTQGTDLIDLVAEGPLPAGTASKLLEPLAAAVEAAHHNGLVLGTDHPMRLRVTADGKLRLAFPGPYPEADARQDVRGLGAALYLLLTGRWALHEGTNGLPAAPTGPDGTVVSPRTLRPALPHEISTVAVRSLVDTSIGGLRTGAAILRVLEQTAADEAEAAALKAEEERLAAERVESADEIAKTKRGRKRKLALSFTALAAATVGVFAWLAFQVIGMFQQQPSHSGPTVAFSQTPGANPQPGGGGNAQPPVNPPKPSGPAAVASVSVYNVSGEPDNVNRIKRVIDGDPRSSWKTMTYRQPFPAPKPGVGVMVTFDEAVKLAKVVVDSPSDGTTVEVRSATSDDARLEDTKVIGSGTLASGDTEIQLNPEGSTKYVLLWITGLAGSEGRNVSELSELTFLRAE
ncbi:protein kinase family protein [Allokutzneria sp. NRRL B-24872]|uniref:protein kinase family protein n=1 Tax=Allokutzneria sp. NRRL B-24872 TaxID=1137961 RepID=UPI000A37D532|nr:protein kinase family protein [Allokutzneria sp. NRRL B-24872]